MKNLLNRLSDYGRHVFRLALIFFIIRLGEVLILLFSHSDELSISLFFTRSLNFDLLFVVAISLIYLPIHFSLSFFQKEGLSLCVFKWIGVLLVIVNLLLTNFFIIGGFLLPAFALEFSFNDIIHVFGTEINSRNWAVWTLDGIVLISSYLVIIQFNVLKKSVRSFSIIIIAAIYIVLSLVTIGNYRHFSKEQKYFENKYQYYLGNSKPVNFIENVIHWRKSKNMLRNSSENDVLRSIEDFQKLKENSHFVSTEYPLLQLNDCNNVLGPFFKSSEQKPNIVLVIMESLSSTFSGTKTLYGSLTPFIDSLRKKGLYWENFYSNADRTFGVLPNILGSLPYGIDDRGYINSVKVIDNEIRYSRHLNLIHVLKENHYKTNFFYGGWDGFDNMTYFFRYFNVDKKINDELFDESRYAKKQHNETAWGFDDKQLYRRSFEDIDSLSDEAFFNIYLTLSNHSPFALADSIYFERDFQEKRLAKSSLKVPLNKMGPISNEELASILFTDDALCDMFEEYKKRDDFNRTIFIIVGDHGGGSLATSNKLAPYQIPMIIYSELLKGPEVFKGLSSHIDMLPSLQCLLEKNYNLTTPITHPFVGRGLDTSRSYSTNSMTPLMVWSNERASFILGNLILEGDHVYYLNEDRKTYEECKNEEEIQRIKKAHKAYLMINNYVLSEKRILPEEIE